MTHEMLYTIVRAIVHKGWNVSVSYDLRSYAEPQYGVSVWVHECVIPGAAFWADSPEQMLADHLEKILAFKEEPK